MRDQLTHFPIKNETAIINLGSSDTAGSHWVAYKKHNNKVQYFDSFGNLKPPRELISYFGPGVEISYNYHRKQNFDSVVCGHLCLKFLTKNN